MMFCKLLLIFFSVNIDAKISFMDSLSEGISNITSTILDTDSLSEGIFKRNLKRYDIDFCPVLYVIKGNLILIGPCDINNYTKLISLVKSKYEKKFYDFLLDDKKYVECNTELADQVKKDYNLHSKRFGRIYLHVYNNILYFVASVNTEDEEEYFKKLGDLIKKEHPEISDIEYCLI